MKDPGEHHSELLLLDYRQGEGFEHRPAAAGRRAGPRPGPPVTKLVCRGPDRRGGR